MRSVHLTFDGVTGTKLASITDLVDLRETSHKIAPSPLSIHGTTIVEVHSAPSARGVLWVNMTRPRSLGF